MCEGFNLPEIKTHFEEALATAREVLRNFKRNYGLEPEREERR